MALPTTPSFRLDVKRALIAGGSSGIGLACAVALAGAGAAVTIATPTRREAVVHETRAAGFQAVGLEMDVSEIAATEATVALNGPFDIIINVTSEMAHVGGSNHAVYCGTKFAVEGFSKAMAIEWGKQGIRVNTICPTFIRTPLTEQTFDDPDSFAWIMDKIKLGRVGAVTDMMGPVVYLASDASAMMTGTHMLIDGGWTAD